MKFGHQIAIIAISASLAGCNRHDQSNTSTGSENPVTAQEVKDKYKDAATATKNYVDQNKDDFVAFMDKKLQVLDSKINQLAERSKPYKDEAKIQADKALAALREERKSVGEQLGKVKQSSAEVWQDVKDGFSSAMDELEKAYEKAKAKFD